MNSIISASVNNSKIEATPEQVKVIEKVLKRVEKVNVICISTGDSYILLKELDFENFLNDNRALSCSFHTKYVPFLQLINSIIALTLTSYGTTEQFIKQDLNDKQEMRDFANALIYDDYENLLGILEIKPQSNIINWKETF